MIVTLVMEKPESWTMLHYVACKQGAPCVVPITNASGALRYGQIVAPHPERMAFSVWIRDEKEK